MATQEWNRSWYVADDAAWRAAGSEISAALTAMGLPKTTDTGQIDWTTSLRPTALGQTRGYEMRKFNDSLQATAPVYIKIQFMSNTSSQGMSPGDTWGIMKFTVQVGTGTDGAGNLTGKVSAQRAIVYFSHTTGTSTATVAKADQANQNLMSGASNRLVWFKGANCDTGDAQAVSAIFSYSAAAGTAAERYGMVLVERSKDANGNDTSDGIVFMNVGCLNEVNTVHPYYAEYIPFSRSAQLYKQYGFNSVFYGDSSKLSTVDNGQVYAFPIYPMEGAQVRNPPIGLLGFLSPDFYWGGASTPVSIYGTTHQYRPVDPNPSTNLTIDSKSLVRTTLGYMWQLSRPMIIWE